MLLISGIAMQIPVTKREHQHEYTPAAQAESGVNMRIQSLVYTGNVDSIVDGIARYFVGSMSDAVTAFLHMQESPLQNSEKSNILFGLVHKLRKHIIDQALVCKQLIEVHPRLSDKPLLYAAATSNYSDVIKDIVHLASEYNYAPMNNLVFDAFKYAVKNNDLKSIEKLYLHGANLTQDQASQLLKVVVCENKTVEMAKFFIERTHADPHYIDDNNKSLLAYAFYHKNKALIHAIKSGKRDERGFVVALR